MATVYDAAGEAMEVQLATQSGDGDILRHNFRGPGRAGLLAVDQAAAGGNTRTVWTFADSAGTVTTTAWYDEGAAPESTSDDQWHQYHRVFDGQGNLDRQASGGEPEAALQKIPVIWRGLRQEVISDLYLVGTTLLERRSSRYLTQAAADSNPYRFEGNRPTSPEPSSVTVTPVARQASPINWAEVEGPTPGYWHYFRTGWAAQGFAAVGSLFRGAGDVLAMPFTAAAEFTSSPTLSGAAGFTSGLVQLPFDIVGGVADIPGLVGGTADTFGAYYQAGGGGAYGTLLGLSGLSGLAGAAESYYGFDILTGEAFTGDARFDRGVIGAGGIGGIVLSGFGASASLSGRLATSAGSGSRVARLLTTNVRTFGLERALTADLAYVPRTLASQLWNDIRYAPRRGMALNPFAPSGFVRSSLPKLGGSFAAAFEDFRPRTFKAGDRVYRSPSVDQFGKLEPVNAPGAWFGTRRTATKLGTESQFNVLQWGNPLEELRVYEFTRDVTAYYGRVAGGKGYQLLIPKDVLPSDVLKYIPPPIPLR